MTISRRGVHAALALCLALGVTGVLAPSAVAQDEPELTLRLLSQTSYTTLDKPVATFRFAARNGGIEPLEDLSVGWSIGSAIRSRSAYDEAILSGDFVTSTGDTVAVDGPLAPAAARAFTIEIDLSAVFGVDQIESLVYPVRLDVRSGGVPVASLNTAVIHIVRDPEIPMLLSFWAEVARPPSFGPDGRLIDPGMERAVGPEGRLASQIGSLREAAVVDGASLDMVVQPSLLRDLRALSAGYQRADGSIVPAQDPAPTAATGLREQLREIAAADGITTEAMPFSAPRLPALLHGLLRRDLEPQIELGAEVAGAELGVTPASSTFRPPGGALDGDSLDWLADRGVTTILADADAVERTPLPNDFAALPTATMTLPDDRTVSLVLPDPGIASLLENADLRADPVRLAQVVLGELATIWREQPVPESSIVRGIAIGLPADLPAQTWEPLVHRLTRTPFLKSTSAAGLVAEATPSGVADELAAPDETGFTLAYQEAIRRQQRNVSSARTMFVTPTTLPDDLDQDLLTAESGAYMNETEPLGLPWIGHVKAETGSIFEAVRPPPQQFTLTGTTGEIPLQMGDPGDTPLRVTIQLQGSQFQFPDGQLQTVVLDGPDNVVRFRVEALASGPHPIKVVLRAPGTGWEVSTRSVTVQSTAVSRIAIVITAGAALILIGLWSRRLLRRTTS